eukprot:scaffold114608_cov72-Phaeocystis_antarctica.AAC.1
MHGLPAAEKSAAADCRGVAALVSGTTGDKKERYRCLNIRYGKSGVLPVHRAGVRSVNKARVHNRIRRGLARRSRSSAVWTTCEWSPRGRGSTIVDLKVLRLKESTSAYSFTYSQTTAHSLSNPATLSYRHSAAAARRRAHLRARRRCRLRAR